MLGNELLELLDGRIALKLEGGSLSVEQRHDQEA